jgi:membrane protease YdiL (CAAX protease family)
MSASCVCAVASAVTMVGGDGGELPKLDLRRHLRPDQHDRVVCGLVACNETSTFRSGCLFAIFTAAASLLALVVATLQRLTNLRLNLIAIGTTLLVAIGEEMVVGGFLLNALAQRIAVPIAVIVSGLVFGSAQITITTQDQNTHENPLSIRRALAPRSAGSPLGNSARPEPAARCVDAGPASA